MSADVRARHRLPGTSTVQAALAALIRLDIISKEDGRYVAVDSLYREWVARKTFGSTVQGPGSRVASVRTRQNSV